MLPHIPHILWVHVQGLTSMKHYQYTEMPSIQATEHSICGTRSDENCKKTMPSSGCCMYLNEELQGMHVLPSIPHVLCVHMQGLASLGHHQYTRILFIQASEHPSCGTRFSKNSKSTKSSTGLSVLLHEEREIMAVLP